MDIGDVEKKRKANNPKIKKGSIKCFLFDLNKLELTVHLFESVLLQLTLYKIKTLINFCPSEKQLLLNAALVTDYKFNILRISRQSCCQHTASLKQNTA
ncbi:hypothetical protein AAE02nite_16760 [Adhaeribacter aerolatus]|uniref:Uncharacterized protein n=1 Tax=Adhaeribacter aerolatus TaxID=670289 RepID=A0A512AWB4_9BACT|nr:hypothetical protein AAE02nite_16760 [Adhaeribacter aerolatus]